MTKKIFSTVFQFLIIGIISIVGNKDLLGQNRNLVWSDEFNGPAIDQTRWQFEMGRSNDNIHYYTDRSKNVTIEDGKLLIIAQKENYKGYEYTSGHINTEQAQYWKYGRIEASIKLPEGAGFVPAFWMIPEDNIYGWWPNSGEIDIMEHPTNEKSKIYGTVHTQFYNLFLGPSPPEGGTIEIPDAESTFHLYAIEWSQDQIDFFVDDVKYFSFENNGAGFQTWPFDQPFFIILNLAVGGGWVGPPPSSTKFPAVMEVDYVRVYQDLQDLQIIGPDYVAYLSENVPYSLSTLEETDYAWMGTGGDETILKPNLPDITVDYGIFSPLIEAKISSKDSDYIYRLPVKVSANLLKNGSFETGVKYWKNNTSFPPRGYFNIQKEEKNHREQSMYVEVFDPAGDPWDVQLSQQNLQISAGEDYQVSFWAKTGGAESQINVAVINLANFGLIGVQTFTIDKDWTHYTFEFKGTSVTSAAFNIDFGGHLGTYYLDDIVLTTSNLKKLNLVENPDFFDLDESWQITSLSGAEASGEVLNGEYRVSIQNSGTNPWDIHLGQSPLPLEQGNEYEFSFEAYADSPRDIIPLVGKNSEPWTVYHDLSPIVLSTTRNTYKYTFTMGEPTDLQARLGFDLGGNVSSVYFDNVLLRKSETTTTAPYVQANSNLSWNMFPNPVDDKIIINFALDRAVSVVLNIYSPSGEILNLVDNFLYPAEHEYYWNTSALPAGIYFCNLKYGHHSETQKIVIAH